MEVTHLSLKNVFLREFKDMQFYKQNQFNLVDGHDLKTRVTLLKELTNVQYSTPTLFSAYLNIGLL